MANFGRSIEKPQRELTPLATLSWVSYMHMLSGMTDEAKRVIKAGGLQDPAIIENLKASRLATSNQVARSYEQPTNTQ
jgi:hypothetical protein